MKRNDADKRTKLHRPDERKPETIDGKTGTVEPTPPPKDKEARRIDLSSLRDVRLELAAVYRKMDAGEIESADGTKRAYVLRQVADIIEMSELEQRILELEAQQARGAAIPGQRQLPARTLN